MFTSSRAFKISEDKLTTSVIKTETSYYVPIDHPVVAAFVPLDQEGQIQASRELLQSKNIDFWSQLAELPEKTVKSTVDIQNDFKPVPKEDWISLIKLYAAFCQKAGSQKELEVGGLLLVNREDKQLRVVIPEQTVTKASVSWQILGKNLNDRKKIFFLDGTQLSYEDFKENWDLLGVTHSHNTMTAVPSGVDDTCEVSERGKDCPTGIHVLVGEFKDFSDYTATEPKYTVYSSISHLGKRYRLEAWESLVEDYNASDWLNATFSDKVLTSIRVPAIQTYRPFYKKPANNKTFGPVTTYSGFPRATQRPKDYTGKAAPGNNNYSKLWNHQRAVDGLNHLFSWQRNQSHQGADDILLDSAYETLESVLDFLYHAMLEDPESVAERVRDYFSEMGEVVNVDLDSPDNSFPTDNEIANLVQEDLSTIQDPFYVSDEIGGLDVK